MRRRRKRIIEPAGQEPEAAPIPRRSASDASSTPEPAPIAVGAAPVETAPVAAAAPPRPRMRPGAAERWGKIPRTVFDGYRLDALLGEGSMGAVFRAEQLSLHRPVAIKVLAPRLAKNERFLRRFLREARAVAKLNHPNVVSGIDVGEARGLHFFVMELVEGATLLEVVQRGGALESLRAARIVQQVARALEHADRHNLIHRDVKPGNVIITRKSGVAKLCDLGLAKEVGEDGSDTTEGLALGTPLYVSPEQARGDHDVDIRGDLYSLGATFYEALTGRPPFHGMTHAVIMAKHLTEDPEPVRSLAPDVLAGCAVVCERLLEKDREDRYQNPTELIAELETVIDGTWREEPLLRSKRRRSRRRFR